MKTLIAIIAIGLCGMACTAAPACPTPAPQPTPQIIMHDVPGPTIYKNIPVTPTECLGALDAADAMAKNFYDFLGAIENNDTTAANKTVDELGPIISAYGQNRDMCRNNTASN